MALDPKQLQAAFFEAVAATPGERPAVLDRVCAGDLELRRRVELLMRAHDDSGDLPPAVGKVEGTGAYEPGAAAAPRPELQAGDIFADRYKLREKLGEGGMGIVWVADQTTPVQRRIALKVIKSSEDSRSLLARFEQERQALALMDHPNIAKVLDAGVSNDARPYFVMELIKGVPLTKYCDEAKLTPKERLELFVQVCQAVQHAHQKGIIHRDLKPSNILIGLYDGRPVPKVIDFGVAKATGPRLSEQSIYTEVGAMIGTLEYMSPEQAALNNLDIDTRSDIYALGVILYELLTGSVPFSRKELKAAGFVEMLRIIKEVEPPKPSTRLSGSGTLPSVAALRHTEPKKLTRLVRGELDWIVMKCLEKDRSRRFETANGLARDVQRYLADEVVEARPPSRGYRLKKFVRRHKGQVLAAVAVVVALVVGVAAVVTVQLRANRELAAKNAELAEEQAKVEARNKELADEQQKVQARFDLAQKAIATLHTGVTEDLLLKSDQFKELRNQLLKAAADFYGELEKLLEGQTDAKSRRLLATGYFQLGELTRQIGSKSDALAVHRKALALRRELAAAAGADVEMRLDVPRSLGAVGMILWFTGDAEGALACYREQQAVAAALEAEFPTKAVQTVLAQSFSYSGFALQQLGKAEDALAANGKAVAILRKLVEANPGDTGPQFDLAGSLFSRGYLLWEMGKWAEDFVTMENARVIMEKLVKDHPTVARFQWLLGNIYKNMSSDFLDEGKPAEALALGEKALAITHSFVDAYPGYTASQGLLGSNLMLMGVTLADLGKPAEAKASLEKARAIFEKLAEANPTDITLQVSLAQTECAIGELLAQIGKPGDALQFLEKSLKRMRKQAEAHRNSYASVVQDGMASSLEKIGLVLSASGKRTEGFRECQEALTIREKLSKAQPTHIFMRGMLAESHSVLGRVQRRGGQPAEAVASFRSAVMTVEQLPTFTPRNHYDLACSHALLAGLVAETGSGLTAEQGAAEAERAMAALRQAIAVGYNSVGRLRSDASLDALRQREDFQKLVKELEQKVSKMLEVVPRPEKK